MILAHGAGIDEAAFVVLPLLVFAALRWLNRRRSPHQDEARDTRPVTRNDAASS
jgi:hypothetical protein